MRRQAGFSLVELMIVTAVLAGVLSSVTVVVLTIRRAERTSEMYVRDLHGLRRVLRLVERDVREAGDVDLPFIGDVIYLRDQDALWRDGRLIARNIDTFKVARKGDLVFVEVRLGSRSGMPAGRRASITERIRLRSPSR